MKEARPPARSAALIATVAVALTLAGCERYRTMPTCSEFFKPGDMGRFLPDQPGIALDPVRNLKWFRCNAGQRFVNGQCTGEAVKLSLAEANRFTAEFSAASGKKWRLPTLDEMGTIIESRCVNPAVNPNVFPGMTVDNYWTSTPNKSTARLSCTRYTFNGNSYCREDIENARPFLLILE